MNLLILSFFCLLFPIQGRCSGIVVPGGYAYKPPRFFSTIQFHSPFWGKTRMLPFSLNNARASHICQALSNSQLLVAGGETPNVDPSTEIVNLRTGIVTHGGDLKTARRMSGHAVHNGVVYACGGCAAAQVPAFDTCEAYSNGQWSELEARMIQGRVGPGMVATYGGLIIAGGTSYHGPGNTYFNSAEVYSFESKTFTSIASMSQARAHFGMAVLGDWVFVCGGMNPEPNVLKSCEKYSIEKNTWHPVADLTIERATTNMVVFDGQLFMLGGIKNDYESVKSIEVYNKTRDEWKIQGELVESRSWTCGVAIYDCYVGSSSS